MKSNIKILLINPPQRYYGNSLGFNVYFPLGLLYIAAMVKDICDIKVYDSLVEDYAVQKGDDWLVYGAPLSKIKEVVLSYSPDIVGITIPFSAQSESAKNVARTCREVKKDITVLMGGPHIAVKHDDFLLEGLADYCILGEGEISFKEFVEKFINRDDLENICGVACRVNGEIKYTPRTNLIDLDDLPFPAYDLINPERYLGSPNLYKSRSGIADNSISMITSRGCPYKCIFCSVNIHMGHRFRYHSPDYVINHIKYCINQMGITNFHFEDDNISMNSKRFENILDRIIDEKIKILWDTPNGIRADTLSKPILKKIKKSGCFSLQIAIESGNQKVLDNIIKKGSNLDAIYQVVKWCNEIGIVLRAFYVIGFPGETINDIMDTVHFALKLFKEEKVFPILLFATPLYGTELYNQCLKMGIIKPVISDEEFAKATQFFGYPLISTSEFTANDLKDIGEYFEEEMDKFIDMGTYRQVLTDKKALFAGGHIK
jgi:anaerobic magnesium-protoporphyrin IX monomethyl ester cyclase